MSETRKIAAILAADVVGFSKLAGADEDRTLARLRSLRSDLIDPTIAVYHGRVVKRTGDGALVEFRSVVEAQGSEPVRCVGPHHARALAHPPLYTGRSGKSKTLARPSHSARSRQFDGA